NIFGRWESTVSGALVHIAMLAAAIPFAVLVQGQVFREMQLTLGAADHTLWLGGVVAPRFGPGRLEATPQQVGHVGQCQQDENPDQAHGDRCPYENSP